MDPAVLALLVIDIIMTVALFMVDKSDKNPLKRFLEFATNKHTLKARLSLVFFGSSQHFKKYRFTKYTTVSTRKNGIIKLGKLRLHFIRSSTIWVH